MIYHAVFNGFVEKVLDHAGFDEQQKLDLWSGAATAEGVAYGRSESLKADEAAAWVLSAGALLRMTEGALPAPEASRIIHAAHKMATVNELRPDLLEALAGVDQDRREWVAENHEFQAMHIHNPSTMTH